MVGLKFKIDYLPEELEILKIREVNDRLTVVDYKHPSGEVGTVSTRICNTMEGEPLYEFLKKKEIAGQSS